MKREYYNPEPKERFLEEYKKDKVIRGENFPECVFWKSRLMEEALGKDLCDFTTEEIINYYKTLNMISEGMLKYYNHIYGHYFNFCLQNNYTETPDNHFLYFNSNHDVLVSCLNALLLDAHIVTKEQIDEMFHSNQIRNVGDKFLILALFEGIKGSQCAEIINAKIQDLEYQSDEVIFFNTCEGRSVRISSELYRYATYAHGADYYNTGQKSFAIPPGDLILRNYKSEDNAYRYNSLWKRFKKALEPFTIKGIPMGEVISPSDIYRSGQLHYIKRRMEETGLSFSEYVNEKKFSKEMKERRYPIVSKKSFLTRYRAYFS